MSDELPQAAFDEDSESVVRLLDQRAFRTSGFAVLPRFVDVIQLKALRTEADRLLADSSERGGVRNVLSKSVLLADFAASGAAAEVAGALLGPEAEPTKLTLFDKTPAANWSVSWHQDLTITVEERLDLPGYGRWTIKDGLPHVQPPVALLQETVAVRLHLDDTPAENGALRVIAGTHVLGRLCDEDIAEVRGRLDETVCSVPAGGAMVMSPLLLHASSRSGAPSRRRVLHFEYSSASLPEGLVWSGRLAGNG